MNLLPPETTWFDVATFGVAALGVLLGSIGLVLTIRRDRQQGRVNLRLSPAVEGDNFALRITNSERRAVSAERAGLAIEKDSGSLTPFDWDRIRSRVVAGALHGDSPLPQPLAPGDPGYVVKAPLYAVRGAFFPNVPEWAWVEDAYGNVYWERLPASVQAAIRATKRRRAVDDEYGGFRLEEIDDDEPLAAADPAQRASR